MSWPLHQLSGTCLTVDCRLFTFLCFHFNCLNRCALALVNLVLTCSQLKQMTANLPFIIALSCSLPINHIWVPLLTAPDCDSIALGFQILVPSTALIGHGSGPTTLWDQNWSTSWQLWQEYYRLVVDCCRRGAVLHPLRSISDKKCALMSVNTNQIHITVWASCLWHEGANILALWRK